MDDYAGVLALKIAAEVLRTQGDLLGEPAPELWLVLGRKFISGDDLPLYFLDEVPILAGKSVVELRGIHEVKKAFVGCRLKS